MFSDLLLKKFKIKVAGDEGDNQDPPKDPPKDPPADLPKKEDDDKNEGDEEEDDDGKLDLDSLPKSAQKLIKNLRSENAKHRTKNNNLMTKQEKLDKVLKTLSGEEGDDEDPETKLEALQQNYSSVATKNAILELALENGVNGAENYEYFEFLMSKKINSLEEGEEMTEEDVEEIVTKCSKGAGNKANTSTKTGEQGKKPDEKADEVTQEEFNKMGMVQKSRLYQSNPELYNKLMKGFTGR